MFRLFMRGAYDALHYQAGKYPKTTFTLFTTATASGVNYVGTEVHSKYRQYQHDEACRSFRASLRELKKESKAGGRDEIQDDPFNAPSNRP